MKPTHLKVERAAILVSGLRRRAARWRIPLTLFAAAFLMAGLTMSVRSLGLHLHHVAIGPALLILFVCAPLILTTASLSLQISARALGRTISFWRGLGFAALGGLAEILPVPGGAVVRGAALVRVGARVGESTWIVTLTAVLTLSMASIAAGISLIAAGLAVSYLFVVAGLTGALASSAWIARRAGLRLAVAMVAVRLAAIVIAIASVIAAFASIGLAVPLVNATLLQVAPTLGSAVSIVPAGLGLSEALAAALAILVDVPPSAAFIATAINRVLGLCVCGVVAFVFACRPWLGKHQRQAT